MPPTTLEVKQRRVAYWLLLGVFMIIVQIIIGGITRLTGSGLSITEWKPIMGTLPPLNEEQWMDAFNKYKGIAQFKYENSHFTLHDFKFIFFWEWFHRLWARSLGVVFAIPFVYFIVKKYFTKSMIGPLILLFILGGLQGLVGWIMVQSGLNDTDTRVSHIRLTIHFIAALILLIYTFWFALKLIVPQRFKVKNNAIKNLVLGTLGVLTLQLIYGGFMAGLRGATYAPTWPSINGNFAPPTLAQQSWINEPLNIHFIHRGLAYILILLFLILFIKIRKECKDAASIHLRKAAIWPLFFVLLQVTLGIFTVLSAMRIEIGHFGIFETMAELHQIVAIFLLMSLVYPFYLLKE